MKILKVREDKIGAIDYSCDECCKRFQDKDIIFELDMYEDYHRFCSTECIMKWLETDIEKIQIETYKMTDEQKTYKEVSEKIKGMQRNTRININEYIHVEFYKNKGLKQHYIIFDNYGKPVAFDSQTDVINYIINKIN